MTALTITDLPPLDPGSAAIVAAVRGRPEAMVEVARSLLLGRGKVDHARALAAEALAIDRRNRSLAARARSVIGQGIGGWYWSMVQDAGRHALYAEALSAVMPAGATVLDIGAGTGLFAMMAARAGAAAVVACEIDATVAAAARAVVANNGLADRISIVGKPSSALEVGVDLPAKADLLLWDNLANNLLGAGAATAIDDARARLVRADAKIMPYRVELVVALADFVHDEDHLMGVVDGFDLTAFNMVQRTDYTVPLNKLIRRSDPVTMFKFDFTTASPITAGEARRPARVSEAGRVSGVVQWLRFHLAPGVVYETDGASVSAFGCQFHTVDPFTVVATDMVEIGGAHDREQSWFWAGLTV